MKYQDYIDLGFKRVELNDSVELKQTGYPGYSLEKKINKRIMVCVDYPRLEEPKLYIKKGNTEYWHIFKITAEAVKDLIEPKITFTRKA